MTDERIDALVRRLDVPAEADSSFVEDTLAALAPVARAAQRRDARWFGRWWAGVQLAGHDVRRALGPVPAGGLAFLVLVLMVALLASVIAVGVRPSPFGVRDPLIVSRAGELLAIDVDGDRIASILRADAAIAGVSRSPDGRRVAFWTATPGGHQLEVAHIDGSGRRQIAPHVQLTWTGCIDVWSTDSRRLASEVRVGDEPALLVVDVQSGAAHQVRPPDGVAQCPLWSPDGRWLAFAHVVGGQPALAVIGADGAGFRRIAGGDALRVAGANSWSPDGEWIYFDAAADDGNHIYRASVRTGELVRLTDQALAAFAPALSPDGRQVSFIAMAPNAAMRLDLYVMSAEGGEPRLLLEGALNDGWSSDGRWILAEWQASAGSSTGGLALVDPRGGAPRIVLPFDRPCPLDGGVPCLDGVGWGQPRP